MHERYSALSSSRPPGTEETALLRPAPTVHANVVLVWPTVAS